MVLSSFFFFKAIIHWQINSRNNCCHHSNWRCIKTAVFCNIIIIVFYLQTVAVKNDDLIFPEVARKTKKLKVIVFYLSIRYLVFINPVSKSLHLSSFWVMAVVVGSLNWICCVLPPEWRLHVVAVGPFHMALPPLNSHPCRHTQRNEAA